MVTGDVRHFLFPAFDVTEITGQVLDFVFPAVFVVPVAVEAARKFVSPAVYVGDLALFVQVEVGVGGLGIHLGLGLNVKGNCNKLEFI